MDENERAFADSIASRSRTGSAKATSTRRTLAIVSFVLLAGVVLVFALRSDLSSQRIGNSSVDGFNDLERRMLETSERGGRLQMPRLRPVLPDSVGGGPASTVESSDGSQVGELDRSWRLLPGSPGGTDESTHLSLVVDERSAEEDYARFGDGPVASRPQAHLNATGSDASDDVSDRSPSDNAKTESCLPAFSACRTDTDCCGRSVCRSRPGTISGSFECTPN